MSRFTFVILSSGLFFALVGTVQAAPVLNSLPSDGSTINIGDTIDYSWSPVSTKDNCIHFFPPGAAGWENWVCLGRNIGSYSKNTAGLNEGLFSAEVATKKCSFFGLICSWDYSNVIKVNLTKVFSPPPPPLQEVVADIKVNGSDTEITVRSGTEVDVSWSSTNAGGCNITPCSFSFPNSCESTSGLQRPVVNSTTDFKAICYSNDGSEFSASDTVRVNIAKNTSPAVSPLRPQAPADYCVSPLTWTLSWNFYDPDADSYQSNYQIRVFDIATGREVLSRFYPSSSNSFAVPAGALSFNKTYSWKIKVWDNKLATGEATGENFTTIPHRAPMIDFRWTFSGQRPAINEIINFYDETTFYDQIAMAAKRKWQWTFWDGLVAVGSTTTFNTQAKAFSQGEKKILLQSTDADGLTCSKTKILQIGRSVPKIKEIFPR
ncbi:MAG: hypothetical protein AAB911_00385 [Patescibacteria group bacterium]